LGGQPANGEQEMKRKKQRMALTVGTVASVILTTVGASQACAQTVSYYNITDVGSSHNGLASDPGPYVNVQVDLTSSTTADLTFTSYCGGQVCTNVPNGGPKAASIAGGPWAYLIFDGAAIGANINASSFAVSSFPTPPKNFTNQSSWYNSPNPLTSTSSWVNSFDPGGNFEYQGMVSGGALTFPGSLGSFNLTIYDQPAGPLQPKQEGCNYNVPGGSGYQCAATQIPFTVTDTSGTWASAANVLKPNGSGYFLAANHIVGCAVNNGACDESSLGAYNSPQGYGVAVPEPGTPTLLLSGLFGLGLVGLARRRTLAGASRVCGSLKPFGGVGPRTANNFALDQPAPMS